MFKIFSTLFVFLHKKLCMTKFLNKESCFIDKNIKFGKNVVVYENNHIEGNCYIGDDTVLLPNNFIKDSSIGKNCKILGSCIEESTILNNVSMGPFARLRPLSFIEDNCKIGNFVEIKNSHIGSGTKISHLAYVGDASVGKNCNIGCGVIFANYNGKSKNKIEVGNHVFIGSNCNLIAPLKIAGDSFIAAGTTVTNEVKERDFVIGRLRQVNKSGRAKKYWQ